MRVPSTRILPLMVSGSNLAAHENLVIVKTLERCFKERIVREMGVIIDTVENKIQNANSTAIDSIIPPKMELAVRLINASSGQEATRVLANSAREKQIGITAPFENVSERSNTLLASTTNDETDFFSDEVSELSIPGT